MPFLAVAAATTLVSGGVAAAVGGATWAAFSFTATFLTSAIIGGLSQALAKSPAAPGQAQSGPYDAQNRNVTVTQPISPWQLVVGEARVGGVLTFAYLDSIKQYYHIVVTLAAHAIDGIEEIILNGEVITPDMLDADGSGAVISGNWGGYTYFPRLLLDATVPGSPYQITLPLPGGGHVSSIDILNRRELVEGPEGASVTNIQMTDVSPAAPVSMDQYSRVDNVLTFSSVAEGQSVTVNYTERVPSVDTRIKLALGDETGQPFPELVAESEGRWTDAHRQTGHAKLYLRFSVEKLLKVGAPQISAVVRGARPYDPRTGLSAFSSNPALLLAWYLNQAEVGFDAAYDTDISADELEAAANLCDERVLVSGSADAVLFTASASTSRLTVTGPAATNNAVLDLHAASGVPVRTPRTGDGVRLTSTGTLPAPLAAGTTYYVIRQSAGLMKLATSFANAMASTAITISDAGSGTHTLTPYDEPRYTANGDFNTAQARSEMQNGLLGAMAGRLTEISGLWRIYAGGYEAPTVTLSEKELAGAVHIEPVPATADAANGVRGVFMDTANLFTPTDFPAVSDDTYVAADGGEEIWASLDFTGFVTSSAQAQRLAKIELRRRRYALTFTAPFQLSAYRAMTARTVAMDFARYGWSAGTQEFEVGSSRFTLMKSGEGGDAPALGVELTLRQSAAAIWDWTLSEQQVQAAVRNTSLPSPFDVTDPGVPTVTESLYQTSGSAGVKTRALLAWSAADSLPVARYNLRYKAVDDADYTYPPSVPAGTAGAATAQIDDLGAGLYLFGIQAENLNGVQSQWVSVSKELVGLTAPPSDLTNFSITPTPGAQTAACSWDKLTANSDLDVLIGGAIEVRFSPLTSGATWNDGTVAAHVPGDSTSADVPHLSGTYMARAFDSSGNQSENAVSVITTAPDVINYNAVASLTEDATFTGAKSSTVVVGSVLTLDGGLAIDSITDLIDTWTAIDTESGVAASGTYDFSTYIDLGATYTSRVTATLKTQSVDVNDSVDARIDPIDSWGAIDGPEISDVDATLYIATTDDDPAGTPTWSSWRPFVIGDYKARAFKYRTVLTSSNQNHNIQVINLGAAVDMPDRTQGARDVTSGAGTYSVAYATPFKALPRIGITGKDMGTGDYFTVSSETVNGFDVVFRNSAAAAVSRKFDWEAKGY